MLWTRGCRLFLNTVISFSLSMFPRVEWLDHMIDVISDFWGVSTLPSKRTPLIYIPSNSVLRWHYHTSLPAFIALCSLEDSHSNWSNVRFHCVFFYNSLKAIGNCSWVFERCLSIFSVFLNRSAHLVVEFLSFLNILDIHPLSVDFLKIFSHILSVTS